LFEEFGVSYRFFGVCVEEFGSYFFSKVLQGPEVRYQALEKAALLPEFYGVGND